MKRILLCKPGPSCCPEVTVHDNKHVDITDRDQTVEFTPEQWEMLRQKIKEGEL